MACVGVSAAAVPSRSVGLLYVAVDGPNSSGGPVSSGGLNSSEVVPVVFRNGPVPAEMVSPRLINLSDFCLCDDFCF